MKDAADAMAERGMRDAGYRYVVVDDCWQDLKRDADGQLQAHPTRFPSGIKALADYVHDLGLEVGLYLAPGSETCAMFWDDYPGVKLGSYGHERSDVAQLDEWGVDYLKYDWCRADETDGLDRPTAFAMMRDELDALDRPILYSISEYGETEPWKWAPDVAHQWRTTGDIQPAWWSIAMVIDQQVDLHPYARPGTWNDPDMLQLGNGPLTLDENRSHFTMWAMLAAPLMLGTDLQAASPELIDIVTDEEVIAIDQDPLGRQAQRVRVDGDLEVWARPLADDAVAVTFLNRGETQIDAAASLTEVGAKGDKWTARDLWAKKDLGPVDDLTASVAPHGVVILRLESTS